MKVNLVITVSQKYMTQTKEISEKLIKDGLDITAIHEFGVITGSIEKEEIPKINLHHEIESLTAEEIINISPPDETIQ